MKRWRTSYATRWAIDQPNRLAPPSPLERQRRTAQKQRDWERLLSHAGVDITRSYNECWGDGGITITQEEQTMGANNWMHCPKCVQEHTEHRDREIRIAKNLYGVIPVAEYTAAMEKAEAIPERKEPTFRETFDIGMEEDGSFSVGYSGDCTVCGYSHRFEHTEEVPL